MATAKMKMEPEWELRLTNAEAQFLMSLTRATFGDGEGEDLSTGIFTALENAGVEDKAQLGVCEIDLSGYKP